MPKKVIHKLDKVISTKVSLEVFNALSATAKSTYMRNDIAQPTISEFLRFMIETFMNRTDEGTQKFWGISEDFDKYRMENNEQTESVKPEA